MYDTFRECMEQQKRFDFGLQQHLLEVKMREYSPFACSVVLKLSTFICVRRVPQVEAYLENEKTLLNYLMY